MRTTNLTEVLTLIRKLSTAEKLQLVEYLAHDLRQREQPTPRLSWREARGLGKEIWKGVDIAQYIDELRNEWDR